MPAFWWETDWKRWFAWRPVRLSFWVDESRGGGYADSGNWAWLRYVERKTIRMNGFVIEATYRRAVCQPLIRSEK